MKRLAVFILLCAVTAAICACSMPPSAVAPPSEPASTEFFAMDTYLTFAAYGENAQAALEEAKARVTKLESLWSVTDPGSEIYAANHSGGKTVAVSSDTAGLVRYALSMADRTDGALDPTLYPVLTAWGFTTGEYRIPGPEEIGELLENVAYSCILVEDGKLTVPEGAQLDLGSIGKGYAADEAAAILEENGVQSALLDFGGNVRVVGSRADGSAWRIGIRDPDTDGILGMLEVTDMAVCVSGGYERYFVGEDGERYWHILDPATGMPARSGLVQVAVAGDSAKACDALSTALFVKGLDGAAEHWREHPDFEMVLLAEDRTIYVTEGLADAFSLGESQAGRRVEILSVEG